MSGSNSNIQLAGTDFDQIKSNLITYLQGQNILKDASYTGSVLSILMDILAYNTHYNSFYLNMVGNEMFLDTATRRSSVVSRSKLLGYTPLSTSCPTAVVDIRADGLTGSAFYLPKYTKFLSEKLDNANYTFVTTKDYLVNANSTGHIVLQDVELKSGEPISYTFVYSATTNFENRFKIPDANIDLETLEVVVQTSTTNYESTVFNKVDDKLLLDGNSEVYFIQESLDGNYEMYFGNGIIGKSLFDGNLVKVKYLTSSGADANYASSFVPVDTIASYDTIDIITTVPAHLGRSKEDIDSIRYTAPKVFSAQGRAVTVNDYIALIKKNSEAFPLDAVNVWRGDDNQPPVYGKVFISVKPKGGYSVTENQKNLIKETIVKPINVVTIDVDIVDVDYTFLTIESNVLLDPTKTTLTENDIRTTIMNSVKAYSANNLNSFESTLIIPDLITTINSSDQSIITNEQKIKLQKRISPTTNTSISYVMDFGIPIKRDFFGKSISTSDSFQMLDINNISTTGGFILRKDVYIEEVPASSTSIDSIVVLNPGTNYTKTPIIKIVGDGKNATAHASIVNGKIKEIIIDNPGEGYTQAIVQIDSDGGGGILGAAKAILQGRYGDLRTYYYNNGIKYVLNPKSGTVDYYSGVINLIDFKPYSINNNSGQLKINVIPDTNIVYSERNKLLTLDQNDPTAVSINIITK